MVSLAVEYGCTDGLAISLMSCEPVGLWNVEVDREGVGLGEGPFEVGVCVGLGP